MFFQFGFFIELNYHLALGIRRGGFLSSPFMPLLGSIILHQTCEGLRDEYHQHALNSVYHHLEGTKLP